MPGKRKNNLLKKGLLVFILVFFSYMGSYIVTNDVIDGRKEYIQATGAHMTMRASNGKGLNTERNSPPVPISEATEKNIVQAHALQHAGPEMKRTDRYFLNNAGSANAPSTYPGKDSANLPAIKIITEPLQELPASQTKKPSADSLYIIW